MEIVNKDLVHHPQHYNHVGRPECWDEMLHLFGAEEVAVFDIMTAYKYYYRRGTKDYNPEIQDVDKALEYLIHARKMIELVQSEQVQKTLWHMYWLVWGRLNTI